MPEVPFCRAVGTVRMAWSFLESAERQPVKASPQPLVTYFLLGHALELSWKAVLMVDGVTERDLRRIGHDLQEAWSRAESVAGFGIPLSPEVGAVLDMIGDPYQAKSLEYLEPGYYSLPEVAPACSAVRDHMCSVADWVEARVRGRLRAGEEC